MLTTDGPRVSTTPNPGIEDEDGGIQLESVCIDVVLTVLRGGDRRDVALTLSRRPEQPCERVPACTASTSLLETTPLH